MILKNGEYSNQIEIADRGFQYGDGLFETIAVLSGKPVFWDQHWQRLISGCHSLNIPAPNPALLKNEALSLCQQADQAVLKIIVTRGCGGRGYRQPDHIAPTRVLSLHPYPDYPPSNKEKGIVTRFCTTRLGLNPSLAGIKHLNRLEQVLARAEWIDPDIYEGIMLDSNDFVIEGTMSNLFYIKNNTLFTASITHAGVAGIIRSIIMVNPHEIGISLVEHSYNKDELISADEVFVCNSLIGIWPVKRIEETTFSIGPKTREIQQWYDHSINKELRGA